MVVLLKNHCLSALCIVGEIEKLEVAGSSKVIILYPVPEQIIGSCQERI